MLEVTNLVASVANLLLGRALTPLVWLLAATPTAPSIWASSGVSVSTVGLRLLTHLVDLALPVGTPVGSCGGSIDHGRSMCVLQSLLVASSTLPLATFVPHSLESMLLHLQQFCLELLVLHSCHQVLCQSVLIRQAIQLSVIANQTKPQVVVIKTFSSLHGTALEIDSTSDETDLLLDVSL